MTGSSDLLIRPAAPHDVAALHDLVERAYRGDSARQGWTHEADLLDDHRTSDADLASALADPATRLMVAFRDDVLIGTVTVRGLGDGRAYLGMLAVDPALQAGGLGRKLIAAAEDLARDHFAADFLEMTVIDRRAELIDWYERRGFVRTGEIRPFPVAGDHPFAMVVLEKPLLAALSA